MLFLETLLVFDLAAIVLMAMLAYLSQRLGDALKIPPYYKLLYGTMLFVAGAVVIERLNAAGTLSVSGVVPMGLRFCAGAIAFFICMRYWKWIVPEFFKK